MKVNKEENYQRLFEENIFRQLDQRLSNELRIKTDIKEKVDNLIYKILDDNTYAHEYKGYLHKQILLELAAELD